MHTHVRSRPSAANVQQSPVAPHSHTHTHTAMPKQEGKTSVVENVTRESTMWCERAREPPSMSVGIWATGHSVSLDTESNAKALQAQYFAARQTNIRTRGGVGGGLGTFARKVIVENPFQKEVRKQSVCVCVMATTIA
jgi:hypothetical protein